MCVTPGCESVDRPWPRSAVRLTGSTATVTAGCNGPVLRTVPLGADGFVDPVNAAPSRPANELLRFCGNNAPYRGGFALVDGKVVNRIHIDDYVKGVIPRESLPRWADEGGAEGAQVQAVAARTYALAALAKGKQIDDTTNSPGVRRCRRGGSADQRGRRRHSRTDPACRRCPAFTEFSASTGGYTAGGNFPAVRDDGDSVSPTHEWTATVGSGKSAAHSASVPSKP